VPRRKKFGCVVQIGEQLATLAPDAALEIAERRAIEYLARDQRGPRGGRYVPEGIVEFLGWAKMDWDFLYDTVTFRAEQWYRYVRPSDAKA
jgi:hypothetical protein